MSSCSCNQSIPTIIKNKTIKPSLTNVADIDNQIFMSGDFRTALFAGAPHDVLNQLFVRENWTIKRLRDYNDKCTHEVKFIPIQIWEGDEGDEDDENSMKPCCAKEQDELVLTEDLQYIILEYFAINGKPLDTFESGIEEINSRFKKLIQQAFQICDCKMQQLQMEVRDKIQTRDMVYVAINHNIIRLLSGSVGFPI